MPGGYGLYGWTGLGIVASCANETLGTLRIPSIAVKPAATKVDLCRRIAVRSAVGLGVVLIEILGMLGAVDVVVFGWSPRPLRTALRGSLYDIFVIFSWQRRMSRS
jgi:hypothetical protein